MFLVERRGGGHGRDFVPAPDDWYTPRHSYFQTNMRAQLPAELGAGGSPDTLLPSTSPTISAPRRIPSTA